MGAKKTSDIRNSLKRSVISVTFHIYGCDDPIIFEHKFCFRGLVRTSRTTNKNYENETSESIKPREILIRIYCLM